MSELRKDPVVGRWVIILKSRGKRPLEPYIPTDSGRSTFCPFCYGNESKTPKEIMAVRPDGSSPNASGWKVRVVPHKYPLLQIEGELSKVGEGIYDKMNGVGAHEIIIETPEHGLRMEELSEDDIRDILIVFRERIVDLAKDKRFKYILIFKNHGMEAGDTVDHSNSQLIALPIIPDLIREQIEGAFEHYKLKDRCIFCDVINQELRENIRVVSENDNFVAIAPYASRFPFEVAIYPKKHCAFYENNGVNTYKSLANIVKDTLERLGIVLNNPPYNMILHTSPTSGSHNEYYHWHIEIMPKVTMVAGFEWGSGFHINPTSPEDAARYLREAK
ncbi:MAG: galactose-1-phosphate uridylyltransferase [Nitrospinota bacterium]|nr:galactose-1-phosphate uridylyltransferase [Nitrospinota bacterium]